jgi:predicted dehydrogenase
MNTKGNKIPIAIVGGGLNSAVGYAHYCAINLSNKFEIVAGAFSRDAEINKKTAETYGVEDFRLYDNYRNMLIMEKEAIEAVVILTPSDQHAGQVIYAMQQGIPVICEKSLTCNTSEISKIKEYDDAAFISVVYNYICYPMLKELKEIIKRGDLGKITQIQAEMQQEGFLRLRNGQPMKPQKWRLVDGAVPTISLDLGVHVYSIIKTLTNQTPIEVVATENNFGNFSGVVDDVNCLIKYTNGMMCNMWFSKTALGNRNGLRVRVYGTKGSAEWYQADPEYLKMSDNTGKTTIVDRSSEASIVATDNRYNRFKVGHPAGYIEALANFYEDAYDDIVSRENKNTPRKTFGIQESEECIVLFESASRSAKTNKWEKVI